MTHTRQSQSQALDKPKGFTLIELLLALAIFAYAASSVLGLVSTSAKNMSLLEQMTFASWVAENRIAELEVSTQWPPKNNQKGEAEMAGLTWYWRQTVTETAAPQMRSVTISVYEQEGDKNSIFDLETYVVKVEPRSEN